MRHVPAQSRHDSGVCACLVESGLYLSILVYLPGSVFVFSSSLAFIPLAFISHCYCFYFLVARSFSLPEFSFFPVGTCRRVQLDSTPRWSRGALPSLAALGLVARRSSASPGSAPMRV